MTLFVIQGHRHRSVPHGQHLCRFALNVPREVSLLRETYATVRSQRYEPSWPQHMACHVRAVDPAVPDWDLAPVHTHHTTTCKIPNARFRTPGPAHYNDHGRDSLIAAPLFSKYLRRRPLFFLRRRRANVVAAVARSTHALQAKLKHGGMWKKTWINGQSRLLPVEVRIEDVRRRSRCRTLRSRMPSRLRISLTVFICLSAAHHLLLRFECTLSYTLTDSPDSGAFTINDCAIFNQGRTILVCISDTLIRRHPYFEL
ncbi:hypothetical protein ARMGADRAFT_692996 [Armillaria gallica]|uniref:Uncharacterized protein n=1 Tax=Armillaria gallica TaxID=47427 RepID=A0A2H3DQL6_ARMGA|nr:hypothetical protein ARMGADRAFT_692996 [Armillaria gallica]